MKILITKTCSAVEDGFHCCVYEKGFVYDVTDICAQHLISEDEAVVASKEASARMHNWDGRNITNREFV